MLLGGIVCCPNEKVRRQMDASVLVSVSFERRFEVAHVTASPRDATSTIRDK